MVRFISHPTQHSDGVKNFGPVFYQMLLHIIGVSVQISGGPTTAYSLVVVWTLTEQLHHMEWLNFQPFGFMAIALLMFGVDVSCRTDSLQNALQKSSEEGSVTTLLCGPRR